MKRPISVGLLAACGWGVLAALMIAPPATSAVLATPESTQIVQGKYLRLVSVADWDAAAEMTVGDGVQWDIEISADAPDPGAVNVGVSATGTAPLLLDVQMCLQPWALDECPGGAQILQSHWNVPRNGQEIALVDFESTEVGHLRLTVALAADADGGTTQVLVHARGKGETLSVDPGGGLATTGASPLLPWTLVAGIGMSLTGVLLVARRRRTERDERNL